MALGNQTNGHKEVPDLWIEPTEGIKFWFKVFNELRSRGLQDILIAVIDGLRGLPEVIEAVYLQTTYPEMYRSLESQLAYTYKLEIPQNHGLSVQICLSGRHGSGCSSGVEHFHQE